MSAATCRLETFLTVGMELSSYPSSHPPIEVVPTDSKTGGVAYRHVGTHYVVYFTHFIASGAHEATYLFDGLPQTESVLKATGVYWDTHGQSIGRGVWSCAFSQRRTVAAHPQLEAPESLPNAADSALRQVPCPGRRQLS